MNNEESWKNLINSLETDFDSLETNKTRALRILRDKIIEAVKANAPPNCGVLFSGGIDSTLISFLLKKLNIDFICYSVGLENAKDIVWAKKVASVFNLDLKYKILSLEDFEDVIKKVISIIKEPDVMKVTVGSVIYASSLLAKNNNTKTLFSGLGSEEIFAGYERHLKHNFEAIHKECWSGLKQMWQRDISRDTLITKSLGMNLKTPFLDKEVIVAAMNIHPMYKINKQDKKIILRELAEELGIPKDIAWRPKKAAQYGSNFIKGLDKLAKKNGFKLKKEYLASLL